MTISYSNREVLETLSFSDSVFEGFLYNYDAGELSFSCYSPFEKTPLHFSSDYSVSYAKLFAMGRWKCNLLFI